MGSQVSRSVPLFRGSGSDQLKGQICLKPSGIGRTPTKTNMTLENPPFEDVFPIEHGDFPMSR